MDLFDLAKTGFRGLPVPPLTSVTGIASFLECPRRYFLRSVARLRPRFGERAFDVGRRVHEQLDAYYRAKAGQEQAALTAYWKAMVRAVDQELPTGRDLEDAELALVTCRAIAEVFPAWEAGLATKVRVLASEWPFHHAGSKTGMSGRVDIIGQVDEGPWAGRWVLDHKTGQMGRDDVVERTPFSKQARLYCAEVGARGVIWQLIAKTGSRRRQDETRDEYLTRVATEYKAEPGKYFRRYFEPVQAGSVMDDIAGAKALHGCARGRYKARGISAFPQNESACHAFGRCPYLALCRGAGMANYTTGEENR